MVSDYQADNARDSFVKGVIFGLYPGLNLKTLRDGTKNPVEVGQAVIRKLQEVRNDCQQRLDKEQANLKRWKVFEWIAIILFFLLVIATAVLVVINEIPFAVCSGIFSVVVGFCERILFRNISTSYNVVEKRLGEMLDIDRILAGLLLCEELPIQQNQKQQFYALVLTELLDQPDSGEHSLGVTG